MIQHTHHFPISYPIFFVLFETPTCNPGTVYMAMAILADNFPLHIHHPHPHQARQPFCTNTLQDKDVTLAQAHEPYIPITLYYSMFCILQHKQVAHKVLLNVWCIGGRSNMAQKRLHISGSMGPSVWRLRPWDCLAFLLLLGMPTT